METLVENLAKALVDHPESVQISTAEEDGETVIRLSVAQEDMGKVIGKQGRIAKAIRTVVKAAAIKKGERVTVEIL